METLRRLRNNWDYLAILVVSTIPFYGLSTSGIWNIHDQNFPLDPVERFRTSLYVWNDALSGHAGSLDIVSFARIWMIGLWAALSAVGLSPGTIQLLFLTASTFIAGSGFDYFLKSLPSRITQRREAIVIGSTFYMFNPYLAYRIFLGSYPWFDLVSLPFLMSFITRGFNSLERGRLNLKYAVLAALTSIPTFTYHYETALIVGAFTVMYGVWKAGPKILSGTKASLRYLKFIGLTTSLCAAFNMWWLLPIMYLYFESSTISSALLSPVVITKPVWMSQYPLLMLQTLRLNPFVYDNRYVGVWSPWYQWVVSPIMMVLSLVLFSLCVLSTLLKPRDKYLLFFSSTTVVSVIVANGLIGPSGPLYQTLFNNFWFFRAAFNEIFKALHVAVFSIAALLAASVNELLSRLDASWSRTKSVVVRGAKLMLLTLFLALIMLNSYPFALNSFGSVVRSADVPQYYYEARVWIRSQGTDFRIITIPQEKNGMAYYRWNPGYAMVPVERTLFDAPVLDSLLTPSSLDHEFGSYVYDMIITNRTSNAGKLLSTLGVKFVLVPDDRLSLESFPNSSPVNTKSIHQILAGQSDLVMVKRFGDITFYQNRNIDSDVVYGTSSYYILPGQASNDAYRLIVTSQSFQVNGAAFITSFDKVPSQVIGAASNVSQHLSLEYEQLNLTHTLDGWVQFHTNTFSLDTNDSVDAKGSVSAVGNSTGPDLPTEVGYCFCGSYVNWSDFDLLELWVKGGTSFSFTLLIRDYQNHMSSWALDYATPHGWSQFSVRLHTPTVSEEAFDLTRVNMVSVQIASYQSYYKISALSLGKYQLSNLTQSSSSALIDYTRISPIEFRIMAHSSRPFVLVLAESYDLNWEAVANGETLPHFLTNFYANGWFVPVTGDLQIIVRQRVQTYLQIGGVFTVSSMLFSLSMVLYEYMGKSERSRKVKFGVRWKVSTSGPSLSTYLRFHRATEVNRLYAMTVNDFRTRTIQR